jgi:FkbM family methyltransferase
MIADSHMLLKMRINTSRLANSLENRMQALEARMAALEEAKGSRRQNIGGSRIEVEDHNVPALLKSKPPARNKVAGAASFPATAKSGRTPVHIQGAAGRQHFCNNLGVAVQVELPKPKLYTLPEMALEEDFWIYVDHTFHRECIDCTTHYDFEGDGYWFNTHNPVEDRVISSTIQKKTLFDEGVWTFIQGAFKGAHNPHALAVDIGGNIGWFTSLMLSYGVSVVTFEPLALNAYKISKTVERNEWGDRHRLYQNAVGDSFGMVQLQGTDKTNPSNGAIRNIASDPKRKSAIGSEWTAAVDMVTLDSMLDENITVIKIDVEGYELHVLNGAKRLLCNRVVQYILFEVAHLKKDDCSLEALHRFMTELGYVKHGALDPPPYSPNFVSGVDDEKWTNDWIFALRDPSRSPCRLLNPRSCGCAE